LLSERNELLPSRFGADALGHFVVEVSANNQELREVARQHRREDQLREEQRWRSCEQEGEEGADRIIRQSSAARQRP